MRHVGGTRSCEGILLTWDEDIPPLFAPKWEWDTRATQHPSVLWEDLPYCPQCGQVSVSLQGGQIIEVWIMASCLHTAGISAVIGPWCPIELLLPSFAGVQEAWVLDHAFALNWLCDTGHSYTVCLSALVFLVVEQG